MFVFDLFSFFHISACMSDMLKGFILRSGIRKFVIFIKLFGLLCLNSVAKLVLPEGNDQLRFRPSTDERFFRVKHGVQTQRIGISTEKYTQ